MADVEVEVRPWGNSLGVILPADAVRRESISAHDKIRLRFAKIRHPHPDSFGSLADLDLSPQKVKDELRREHAW